MFEMLEMFNISITQINMYDQMHFIILSSNRSTQRETSRSRVENQQTQPTYDVESRNRTRATLVGGECSRHCAKLYTRLQKRYHQKA